MAKYDQYGNLLQDVPAYPDVTNENITGAGTPARQEWSTTQEVVQVRNESASEIWGWWGTFASSLANPHFRLLGGDTITSDKPVKKLSLYSADSLTHAATDGTGFLCLGWLRGGR